MKNKKKKLIVILLALSCLFVVVLGSVAAFTKQETTRNIITTGGVDIELHEYADAEMTTPFPKDGVAGVMPGSSVTKVVQVENTGVSEAWVRVKIDKAFNLADGVTGEPDASLVALDIDETKWTEKDGWYYYNTPLVHGATTTSLFTQVSFDISMPNMYQNSTVEIAVTAQAVQTANNDSAGALGAAGWPEA